MDSYDLESMVDLSFMNKNKLFLIATMVFAIMVFCTTMFRNRSGNCDEARNEYEKALQRFETEGSIRKIELYKTYPGWQVNLVRDTVVLIDDAIKLTIRQMLLDRGVTSWKRPTASWDVTMKFYLGSDASITWRISRINNDREPKMTHIYPENQACFNGPPEYSLSLGDYLEKVTGYSGVNYE